jgi:hypothetical protein
MDRKKLLEATSFGKAINLQRKLSRWFSKRGVENLGISTKDINIYMQTTEKRKHADSFD